MSIFNWENLKKSSLYITPNFPSLRTKRYKFSLFSVISYVLLYTAVVFVLFSLIVIFSPIRQVLLLIESEKIEEQKIKIEQLEKQVLILTDDLEKITATTKRLKYAIMLAGTDSLDSTASIYDSLRRYSEPKPNLEGNILSAFNTFLQSFDKSPDSNSHFMYPIDAPIVRDFNPDKGHLGLDFAVRLGSPIYSCAKGYIVFSDYTPKDGYLIIIEHDGEYKSFYKHCSKLLKEDREFVKEGELIAISGNSGYNTTGPHLHFELWKQGKPVNPLDFLIKLRR